MFMGGNIEYFYVGGSVNFLIIFEINFKGINLNFTYKSIG